MRTIRLLRTAALAVATSGALASSAWALTAEIDPAGRISAPSLGKVSFGSTPQVRCNLTLTGTLDPSISVSVGESLGEVTEVMIRSCSNGSVSSLLGIPWDIDLLSIIEDDRQNPPSEPDSLLGVLISMLNFSINFSDFAGIPNCLYSGAGSTKFQFADLGTLLYGAEFWIPLEDVQFPFRTGSGVCPEEIEIAGEFRMTRTQTIVLDL